MGEGTGRGKVNSEATLTIPPAPRSEASGQAGARESREPFQQVERREGTELIEQAESFEQAEQTETNAGAELGLEQLMRAAPLPQRTPRPQVEPRLNPASSAMVLPTRKAAAQALLETQRKVRRRRFLRDLCVGAGLVLLIHAFVVQVSVVRGLSMAPSLRDGDRLMVDRLSYSMGEVERFDVVVLRYPKNPNVDFVKRIIGLPGDRVELEKGQLFVNGKAAPEGFGHVEDQYARGSWVIPDQCFFVLGDNRPVSCDSREFGMVNRSLLKGKVQVVFWPPSRFTLF